MHTLVIYGFQSLFIMYHLLLNLTFNIKFLKIILTSEFNWSWAPVTGARSGVLLRLQLRSSERSFTPTSVAELGAESTPIFTGALILCMEQEQPKRLPKAGTYNTVFPPLQVATSILKNQFFRKSYLVKLLNKMRLLLGVRLQIEGDLYWRKYGSCIIELFSI